MEVAAFQEGRLSQAEVVNSAAVSARTNCKQELRIRLGEERRSGCGRASLRLYAMLAYKEGAINDISH